MLLALAALSASAVLAAAAATPASDEQREARIIGGRKMEEGDAPYQVSIRLKDEGSLCSDQHFCGGAIISLDAILTAGHCMRRPMGDTDPKTICIVAGTVHVRAVSENLAGRIERDVLRVYVHEEYNAMTMAGHDIAVIRLASPLPNYNANVRVIPLQTEDIPKDSWCFVTGWGLTAEGQSSESIPPILMGVHVPFIPTNTCRDQFYQCRIHEDEICAGLALGGKDACQGDSGGPFVCNSMLTGVVSWGIGCGRKNSPGVYASVKHYRSWIMEKLNLSPHASPPARTIPKEATEGGPPRARCSG